MTMFKNPYDILDILAIEPIIKNNYSYVAIFFTEFFLTFIIAYVAFIMALEDAESEKLVNSIPKNFVLLYVFKLSYLGLNEFEYSIKHSRVDNICYHSSIEIWVCPFSYRVHCIFRNPSGRNEWR